MRKYILMFIICISSFMIYTNNVKASILTADYNPSNPNIQSSISFSNTDSVKSSPNYNYYFRNKGQGTLIFTMISKGGSPFFPISQVTLWVGNGSTNKYFTCEMGTSMTYDDNGGQNIVNTISCPVDLSNNYGIRSINFYRVATGSYLNIWPSRYLTFVQDTSTNSRVESQYIIDSINSAIAQVISGNSGNTTLILNKIDAQTTTIINKLNELKNNSQTIVNNTEDIKNSINDSTIDNNNATGTINNLSGQLASDNTITSLLLLPINFINVLIDGLSGECVPYSLGDLWGTEIVLPCVNLYNTFGVIWYMVDTGLSALVIFKMSKYFIRLFNKLTNLKDGGLEEAYS